MALIGGETAEMPGVYNDNDYDLAGFCVGVVEKSQLLDASRVQAGDSLIALASSGCHSNGYSLVRKILTDNQTDLQQALSGRSLADHLLEPTRIYVKSLQALFEDVTPHALAHITGGRITENLPRILPQDLTAHIDCSSWQLPSLFEWLQQQGDINTAQMRKVFNCGVGMIVAVAPSDVEASLATLTKQGETAWVIGAVHANTSKQPKVQYSDA